MDPSQELVILSGEASANKQTINLLKHELKTTTLKRNATKTAADNHLYELKTQLDTIRKKVSLLERSKGAPLVPKAHLDHAQQRLAMKKRELESKRRECTALEDVIKRFADDKQLMLMDLFDSHFESDRMAMEMVRDSRKNGGFGIDGGTTKQERGAGNADVGERGGLTGSFGGSSHDAIAALAAISAQLQRGKGGNSGNVGGAGTNNSAVGMEQQPSATGSPSKFLGSLTSASPRPVAAADHNGTNSTTQPRLQFQQFQQQQQQPAAFTATTPNTSRQNPRDTTPSAAGSPSFTSLLEKLNMSK